MQLVDLGPRGVHEFPDEATPEQMQAAIAGLPKEYDPDKLLRDQETREFQRFKAQEDKRMALNREMFGARKEAEDIANEVPGAGMTGLEKAADIARGTAQTAVGTVAQMHPMTVAQKLLNPYGQRFVSPEQIAAAYEAIAPDAYGGPRGEPSALAKGAGKFAAEFLSGMTAPENVAALAVAPAAPAAVGRMFQTQMIGAMPQATQALLDAKTPEDKIKAALDLGMAAALPALIERGLAPKPSPAIPDVPGSALAMPRGAEPPPSPVEAPDITGPVEKGAANAGILTGTSNASIVGDATRESNIIQTGPQNASFRNKETQGSMERSVERPALEASAAWLEAVQSDDPKTVTDAAQKLLRSSVEGSQLSEQNLLDSADRAWQTIRASVGYGEGVGQAAQEGGIGASQKQGRVGQPTREPGASIKGETQPNALPITEESVGEALRMLSDVQNPGRVQQGAWALRQMLSEGTPIQKKAIIDIIRSTAYARQKSGSISVSGDALPRTAAQVAEGSAAEVQAPAQAQAQGEVEPSPLPAKVSPAMAGKALRALVKKDREGVHEFTANAPLDWDLSEDGSRIIGYADSRARGPGTGGGHGATTEFINWLLSDEATRGIDPVNGADYLKSIEDARNTIRDVIETKGKKPKPTPTPSAEPAAKEPWQMNRDEWIKWKDSQKDLSIPSRKSMLALALREGKPVPPEVLADYPDLAKPAEVVPEGPKPAETPEQQLLIDVPKSPKERSAQIDQLRRIDERLDQEIERVAETGTLDRQNQLIDRQTAVRSKLNALEKQAMEEAKKGKPLSEFEQASLGRLRLKREQGREMTPGEMNALANLEARAGQSDTGDAGAKTPDLSGPGSPSAGQGPDIVSPQEAQLMQALDILKPGTEGKDSPRISLADRIAESKATAKDIFGNWWLRTKAGAEQYRRLLFGAPRTEDSFWSVKKDWAANRQVNAGVAKQMIEQGRRTTPNQLHRQAMGKYAQALMFDNPQAKLAEWAARSKVPSNRRQYVAASQLTDAQKLAAQQMVQYWYAKGQELQKLGLLNHLIEDYAGQHMVDMRSSGPPSAMNWLKADLLTGKLNTNFKYALKRMFETEFDLESAGYRLKTTDIFDKLANYAKTANDVLADRTAVKAWMEGTTADGKPLFSTGQHRVPIEGETNSALLVNPKVRPHPAWKDANGVEQDISGEYVHIDHPAFKKWQWAETAPDGKQTFVQGDVWAHRNIAGELRNTFGRSHLYDIPGIDTATRVNAQLKGIKLVGFFHQVKTATHAAFHLTRPWGQPEINPHDGFTYDAMRAGLQLFEARNQEIFSEGMASSSILQRLANIPKGLTGVDALGFGDRLRAYQEYLFQSYIPRIKLATYRNALERNLNRYSDLDPSVVRQITATQINSAFGEMNWRLLGINPTFQHGLRLALLAPDFQAAQHGFAAQVFSKYGAEQRMAAAIMIGGTYTAARVLNQLFDDDPHWELKRAFSVVAGRREFGMRTVATDAYRAFTNTSNYVYHRLSPLLSSAIEVLRGVNSMGRKETKLEALEQVGYRAIPMPVTPRPEIGFVENAVASTFGLYDKRYSPISDAWQLGDTWRRAHDDNYRPDETQYPESRYRPLRQALEDGDLGAAQKAYDNLVRSTSRSKVAAYFSHDRPFTGSIKNESAFKRSLSAGERDLYDKAIAERHRISGLFHQLRR